MDGLRDTVSDVVLVIATSALAHFGVEVEGVDAAAAREPRVVQRTAAAPGRPKQVVVVRRAAPR